jgi:hypothetical protein
MYQKHSKSKTDRTVVEKRELCGETQMATVI